MERITISLDDELARQFDEYLEEHQYKNRSEAMRDLIRQKLEAQRLERAQDGNCVGSLTYVYNHHERELAARLTQAQHDHHGLAVSTLHVHLDHDHCMETVMLNGPIGDVRAFADATIARPGVRHGKAYLIPVDVEQSSIDGKPHTHSKPQT